VIAAGSREDSEPAPSGSRGGLQVALGGDAIIIGLEAPREIGTEALLLPFVGLKNEHPGQHDAGPDESTLN